MTDDEPTRRPPIVLGLDGSAGSTAALEWCVRHAPALDAEVVAVFALNPIVSVIRPCSPIRHRCGKRTR